MARQREPRACNSIPIRPLVSYVNLAWKDLGHHSRSNQPVLDQFSQKRINAFDLVSPAASECNIALTEVSAPW